MAVLVPIAAVFQSALVLDPGHSMQEEAGQEEAIEIGQDIIKPTRQTPSPGHDDVTQVVWMPHKSPPTVGEELRAARCRNGLQV